MAEGICRHVHGDRIEAYSAGIETHGLNLSAVTVLEDIGIDISRHRSKLLDDFDDFAFDFVITVCGHADENCPVFPGKTRVIHRGFDDPPKLAAGAGTAEEAMVHYRRVRDEIREFIEFLPETLAGAVE
jgi:arsenate reductase